MSASPPTIFSVAVICVNVGVLFGPGVADVEEGRVRVGVLAVVGEPVARDLDERQRLQDRRVLDDRLDDALQDDVVRELRGFGKCQCHVSVSFGGSWSLVGSSVTGSALAPLTRRSGAAQAVADLLLRRHRAEVGRRARRRAGGHARGLRLRLDVRAHAADDLARGRRPTRRPRRRCRRRSGRRAAPAPCARRDRGSARRRPRTLPSPSSSCVRSAVRLRRRPRRVARPTTAARRAGRRLGDGLLGARLGVRGFVLQPLDLGARVGELFAAASPAPPRPGSSRCRPSSTSTYWLARSMEASVGEAAARSPSARCHCGGLIA